MERSANEIAALVLKAARGGGVALGYGEDLAAAVRFLDLADLSVCPCTGPTPAVVALQTALAWQKRLIWTETSTGAVFDRFEGSAPTAPAPKGRGEVPRELAAHLSD